MEQYFYIYLKNKYGVKKLVLEHAENILTSIRS